MSCTEAITAIIDGLPIDSNKTEVLIGITIDHESQLINQLSAFSVKRYLPS